MQKVKKISFGEEIIKEIINDILYSTPGVATDFNAIIEVCKKDPCINVQYAPKPFLTNIYHKIMSEFDLAKLIVNVKAIKI